MRKPSAEWQKIQITHCDVRKPSTQWCLNKSIIDHCALKPSAQRHILFILMLDLSHHNDKEIKNNHYVAKKPSSWWCLNKNIIDNCTVTKPSAQSYIINHHNEKTIIMLWERALSLMSYFLFFSVAEILPLFFFHMPFCRNPTWMVFLPHASLPLS